MRFKPPPRNSDIGWRVEFRSMDIQFTDHENAAFSIFVVLLTRTILYYKLNLYMPLSLVDVNMCRAQKRDAVHTQKFHFRSSIRPCKELFHEFTLDEIMNGRDGAVGLVSLVNSYLDESEMDNITRLKLKRYTKLISMKANGELKTCSTFMREFVRSHPKYQYDSIGLYLFLTL